MLVSTGSDKKGNGFWEYSLVVYQSSEVQQLCLQLQDEIDADINLILFAAWLTKQKILFTPDRAMQANKRIMQWREGVIKPLRNIRLTVKNISTTIKDDFYREIKNIELSAEFEAQQQLYLLCSDWEKEKYDVEVSNNLMSYIFSLEKKESQLIDKKSISYLADLLNEENKKLSI